MLTMLQVIDEEMFSCEEAVNRAYDAAQIGVKDIDFFGKSPTALKRQIIHQITGQMIVLHHLGLYDCFPICFVRALEAVQLASRGEGGRWIEEIYNISQQNHGVLDPNTFPVNTHGMLYFHR